MSSEHGTHRDPEQMGYADAVAELEQILEWLEHTDVDVDELGGSVRRAASLIEVCRRRLDGARLEVERILTDLDDTGSSEDTEASPTSAAPFEDEPF